jgi:flagellar hook-associated protein 2
VTFDLHSAGAATITVSTDKSSVITKVESLRESYNLVKTALKEATSYDSDTGQAGSLLGNYALQIIQSQLNTLFSGMAPGFRDPDDPYVNLQQVGFSTDVEEGSETEGLLLLDTSVLSEALDEDPDAVANLFASYLDGISDDSQMTFSSALSSTEPGIYNVEVDLDPESENYLKGRFQPEGESWHPWVALSGTSGNYILTGASDYSEKGMALHITYDDESLHTTTVRLKNGIVTELSLTMEDLLGSSGPLETLTENYNEIVDHLDERIETEEERLDRYEELLRMRFARLDAYMNQMNSLGSYLTLWSGQQSQ